MRNYICCTEEKIFKWIFTTIWYHPCNRVVYKKYSMCYNLYYFEAHRSDPPPIFADEIRAREGSYITGAHAIGPPGAWKGRNKTKTRRSAVEFFEISKNTLEILYWKSGWEGEGRDRSRNARGKKGKLALIFHFYWLLPSPSCTLYSFHLWIRNWDLVLSLSLRIYLNISWTLTPFAFFLFFRNVRILIIYLERVNNIFIRQISHTLMFYLDSLDLTFIFYFAKKKCDLYMYISKLFYLTKCLSVANIYIK